MKIFIVIFTLFLIIGCSKKEDCIKRVILNKDKVKADSFIVHILQSSKTQSRVDNEDFDNFIFAANNAAIGLYGTDLKGWTVDHRVCHCGEEEDRLNNPDNSFTEWHPQVGDTCLTNYFSNQNIKVVISHIEYVGPNRCQIGYLVWAKALSGKDSLSGVDGSWVSPLKIFF